MACVHLGYPKDVTLEWDEDEDTFFLSIKEKCIYEFELADYDLDFSFSIPFPGGEGLERSDYVSINSDNTITVNKQSVETLIGVNKKNVLNAFKSIGCQVVESESVVEA
jgi:hypothetical protein